MNPIIRAANDFPILQMSPMDKDAKAYYREARSLHEPDYVVLGKRSVSVPKEEWSEHDGIMDQITYEVSLWEGSLSLEEIPWKYVLETRLPK